MGLCPFPHRFKPPVLSFRAPIPLVLFQLFLFPIFFLSCVWSYGSFSSYPRPSGLTARRVSTTTPCTRVILPPPWWFSSLYHPLPLPPFSLRILVGRLSALSARQLWGFRDSLFPHDEVLHCLFQPSSRNILIEPNVFLDTIGSYRFLFESIS